jgi:hypothetical protein
MSHCRCCSRSCVAAVYGRGAVGIVEIRECHGEAADDFFRSLVRSANRSQLLSESTFERLQRGRHGVSLSDIARLAIAVHRTKRVDASRQESAVAASVAVTSPRCRYARSAACAASCRMACAPDSAANRYFDRLRPRWTTGRGVHHRRRSARRNPEAVSAPERRACSPTGKIFFRRRVGKTVGTSPLR